MPFQPHGSGDQTNTKNSPSRALVRHEAATRARLASMVMWRHHHIGDSVVGFDVQTTFGALDAAIIIVYLTLMAAVGVYFSRRQTSISEFFVARQLMAWLPVGLSLMAALNSGIDYLMQPSATIRYGVVLLAGTSSWIFLYPWVSRVTLPFYRRLNLYTAYEFLEERFDVRVRTLAAGIFIVWRLGWMATAIYVPCLAIEAVTGGRIDLRLMVVVVGIVVTTYTMLGG